MSEILVERRPSGTAPPYVREALCGLELETERKLPDASEVIRIVEPQDASHLVSTAVILRALMFKGRGSTHAADYCRNHPNAYIQISGIDCRMLHA